MAARRVLPTLQSMLARHPVSRVRGHEVITPAIDAGGRASVVNTS
jgi:hypothetical protein